MALPLAALAPLLLQGVGALTKKKGTPGAIQSGQALQSGALQVGAAAARALPSLYKTEAEKENEKRLKELQQRQQSGALGLTGDEERLFRNRIMGANQAGINTALANQRQLAAAGQAQGSGELASQALRASQAAAPAVQQGVGQMMQADLQEAERERQEIEDRLRTGAAYQQRRLGAVGDLVGGAQDLIQQAQDTRRLVLGSDEKRKTAPPEPQKKPEPGLEWSADPEYRSRSVDLDIMAEGAGIELDSKWDKFRNKALSKSYKRGKVISTDEAERIIKLWKRLSASGE